MLVELKAKSQVTIPKDIVSCLGLNQSDQFEINEKDGKSFWSPSPSIPNTRLKT